MRDGIYVVERGWREVKEAEVKEGAAKGKADEDPLDPFRPQIHLKELLLVYP